MFLVVQIPKDVQMRQIPNSSNFITKKFKSLPKY